MGIRFIFHGGTRERNPDGSIRQKGIAHNSAFFLAAKNVAKDYKLHGDAIRIIKMTTGFAMVNEINKSSSHQVKSLDILCHGTPYSLNLSVKENENCGLVTGSIAKLALKAYYSSWDDGVYNFSQQSKYVSDINFSVFSDDARVQIHGCNTARNSIPGDTLSESFSNKLTKANKKSAYVIGHTKKSNPMINGSSTSISGQDYRHGERAIIYRGNVIKTTKQKGLIKHEDILSLLKGGS